MKKKEFYFGSEDDEKCYTLDYHIAEARSENLKEVVLFKAEKYTVKDVFWCRSEGEVTESGYCGKQCENYEPRNGKSGMCKHRSNIFYQPGERVVFKVHKNSTP